MPQRATDLQRPRRDMERSLDQPRDAKGSPYVVLLMPAAHPRLCMRAHLSALALTIFTSPGPSCLALPYPHLPPPESKRVRHRARTRSPPPSSMPRKYKREQQALLPSPHHPHMQTCERRRHRLLPPCHLYAMETTRMTRPRCLHLRLCLPCLRPPRNEDAMTVTMQRHTIALSLVVLGTHLAKIQVCSRRSP